MTTRRDLLAGAGTLAAASTLPTWSLGQAGRVRYEARSVQGRQMLQVYAAAVTALTAAAENNAASWTFQWFTHAVGRGSKAQELNAIFGPNPSAMKTLATLTWSTCKAHFAGDAESSFLPWHRAFVFIFENICRAVTNNNNFTLPYWDYTVDASIPPEFRNPGGATASLFRANRNNGVNAGTPIDLGRSGFDLSILNKYYYDPSLFGLVSGFNDLLDSSMHGDVHVWVGTPANMGNVPTAASDPIFWLHHAMIDRLWASWNARNRSNPTSQAWLATSHHFVDANNTQVTYTNAQLTSTAGPLNYSYDTLAVPPAAAAAQVAQGGGTAPGASQAVLVARAVDTRLTGARTEIKLQPVAQSSPGARLFLKINKLSTSLQPGVVFDVLVPASPRPIKVGTLQFFNAQSNKNADQPFAYELDSKAVPRVPGSLTILAQGEPDTKASPVLGTVEIYEIR